MKGGPSHREPAVPAVHNALVIGAGAAGVATAILLAEAGVSVEVVETKDDIPTLGSGITLQGNALRVLRDLGVWEEVRAAGYAFDTLGLRAPDPAGTLLVELTEMRTGGDDLPATLGMYRPDLARILCERAAIVGAKLRFGTTVSALAQTSEEVRVEFTDGSAGEYDVIVGADGIHSWTRRAIGIDVEPRPTGMGIWRVFAPRPMSVTRTDLYYGGPSYIAGYCPTGDESLYAYVVEDYQHRPGHTAAEGLAIMRELSAAYHGPWDDIRAGLVDPERVSYTKFETHLVDGPWNRGRVVLIGDAAHSCPPTLAQGAAQALEDAAVLAELLTTHDAVTDELWATFADRRLPRATEVVEASVQLGQWLLDRERGDVPSLMGRIAHLLATPA
jgi:2-polyprenyl-6-methoxyphenol hydroxylase-like FAD-dependent oxidoreductase